MSAHKLSEPASLSGETDAGLLDEFARCREEPAFAELVRRHAGWVEGVAQRTLSDRELAQEVAQNVFILLARKAARVKPDAVGPWLHRTTVLECRNARRRERTRQQALTALAQQHDHMNTEYPAPSAEWRSALPVLDEALNLLPEPERTLVVERFFQRRNWRDIGATLGRSEDAARMALAPALDKLERLLRRRGVTVPAVALAATLSFAGSFTGSATAASLTKNALAATSRSTIAGWRSGAGVWLSTAACLIAGSIGGYQFTTPGEAAPAPRIVAKEAKPGSTAFPGTLTTARPGFDLNAVLNELRSLQPSGNEMAKVVRLRAALMDMPAWAVPQVLAVLRAGRWGTDSAGVAAAFFCRWAELDVDAAWAAFREPDLLGAVSQTLPAIFDGMNKDDPARFVRLLNTLPESQYYSGKAEACRAQFARLSLAEMMPHLSGIQAPALRAEMCRWLVEQAGSSGDCALLASLAVGLPLRDVMTTIPPLIEKWTQMDAGAVSEWIATLPVKSLHYWAAMISQARAVSAHDAIAAGQMIKGVPWSTNMQENLKEITIRWMAADRQGALDWLTTATEIPATLRAELVKKASPEKEAGK